MPGEWVVMTLACPVPPGPRDAVELAAQPVVAAMPVIWREKQGLVEEGGKEIVSERGLLAVLCELNASYAVSEVATGS